MSDSTTDDRLKCAEAENEMLRQRIKEMEGRRCDECANGDVSIYGLNNEVWCSFPNWKGAGTFSSERPFDHYCKLWQKMEGEK